jgi:hypothetical protein
MGLPALAVHGTDRIGRAVQLHAGFLAGSERRADKLDEQSRRQPGAHVLLPVRPRRPGLWQGDPYYRARGNYVVNWGNVTDPVSPAATITGPFYYSDGGTTPGNVKLTTITDGTSNTLLLSEVIMAPNTMFDVRGDVINNDRGCFNFMTVNTPNSSVPDRLVFYGANPDPMMPSTSSSNALVAARSRHTAGVNATMGDASVRFVTNSVNTAAWQAMGTMNGNEVISNP